MNIIPSGREAKIDYTNWRGIRSTRVILPLNMWFGHSEYHKGRNWFLKAVDIEKDEIRDFLFEDIHSFELLEK